MHDCNEGEEEEPYVALRIIHVFVHAYATCCGHLNTILSLVYESIGHKERTYEVKNRCLDL